MITWLTKTFTIFGYVVLGFFLLIIFFFWVDTYRLEGKIHRNVFFADTNVSKMDYQELHNHLEQMQVQLDSKRIFLEYQGTKIEVLASDIGMNFDQSGIWEKLYQMSRAEALDTRLVTWFDSFFHMTTLEARQVINEGQLSQATKSWQTLVPPQHADNGDIRLDGTKVVVRYSHSGIVLDVEKTKKLIIDAFLHQQDGYVISAPLIVEEPKRSRESIDDLARFISNFIEAPITLYHPSYPRHTVTITINDAARLLYLYEPKGEDGPVEVRINEQVLSELVTSLAPVPARIIVHEQEKVIIESSRDGFYMNIPATAKELLHFDSYQTYRKVPFVYREHMNPAFSTRKAAELRVEELVSSFTTYHSCCQDRVDNIHRAADLIDNTLIKPGETFSLNHALGERTSDKGFKKAGTIIDGQMEDSIGGGISQFTTTLHNAVYWGGYEIIEHQPHSIYFTRYPVGIEATINWPSLDYVFRNDTSYGLLIDTSYTDTSITISLYSYNFGRKVIGSQASGTTHLEVTGADENSRTVVSEVSDKYGIKPPRVVYVNDTTIPRGTTVVAEQGNNQWDVNVIRRVFQSNETVRVDYWPVHYTNNTTIIKRNPCDVPGATPNYCIL